MMNQTNDLAVLVLGIGPKDHSMKEMPAVLCYHKQLKIAKILLNGWLDNESVQIHNGQVITYKREYIPGICNKMDEIGDNSS